MSEQEENADSIVSDTTIDSDQTVRTPKLFRDLRALKRLTVYAGSKYEEAEMSPVIPINQTTSASKVLSATDPVVSDDGSESLMSESLIPQGPVGNSTSTRSLLQQSFKAVADTETEESQSLIPQMAANTKHLAAVVPYSGISPLTLSSSTHTDLKSQKISDISPVSTTADRHPNYDKSSLCQSSESQKETTHYSEVMILPGITTLPQSLERTSPDEGNGTFEKNINGKKSSSFSCHLDVTSRKLGSVDSAGQENVMQCSQPQEITLYGSQSQSGEIDMSQTSRVTGIGTLEKMDATDKLSARLNKLVLALQSAPEKQMRVIEVTILHSISRLQDILNNKLKQPSDKINKSTLGVLRKLVEATGQNLSQYVAHQKRQQDRLVGASSLTRAQNQSFSNIEQKKKVYNLLKRQKHLMEVLRASCRNLPALQSQTDTLEPQFLSQPQIVTNVETSLVASGMMQDNEVSKKKDYKKICDNKDMREDAESGPTCTVYRTGNEMLPSDLLNPKMNRKETEKRMTNTGSQGRNSGTPVSNDTSVRGTRIGTGTQGMDSGTYVSKDVLVPDNEATSAEITVIPDTQELFSESLSNRETATPADGNELSGRVETDVSSGIVPSSNDIDTQDKLTPSSKRSADGDTNDSEAKRKMLKVNGNTEDEGIGQNVPEAGNVQQGKVINNSEQLWLKMLNKSDFIGPRSNTGSTSMSNVNMSAKDVIDRDFGKTGNKQRDVILNVDGNEIPGSSVKNMKEPTIKTPLLNNIRSKNVKFVTTDKHKVYSDPSEAIPAKESDVKTDLTETSAYTHKVCLTSPVRQTDQEKTWENVSPTATSMSSDVFVVKTKELQRRMLQRLRDSQNQAEDDDNSKLPKPGSVKLDCFSGNNNRQSLSNLASQQVKRNVTNIAGSSTASGRTHQNVDGKEKGWLASDFRGLLVQKNQVNQEVSMLASRVITKDTAHSSGFILGSKSAVHAPCEAGQTDSSKNLYSKKALFACKTSMVSDRNVMTSSNAYANVDTVSSAIESVVNKAREMADDHEESTLNKHKTVAVGEPADDASFVIPTPVTWNRERSRQNTVPDGTDRKSLPSLKDLLTQGRIVPGRNILTVYLENKLNVSSLTAQGRIQSADGQIHTNVSQWLNSLSSGQKIKKIKGYRMVQYKGQSLMSRCGQQAKPDALDRIDNSMTCFDSLENDDINQQTDKAIQVNFTDNIQNSHKQTQSSSAVTAEEMAKSKQNAANWEHLRTLLTDCTVRILNDSDLVSSDDLPDNFWSEDFSSANIPADIWAAVTAW